MPRKPALKQTAGSSTNTVMYSQTTAQTRQDWAVCKKKDGHTFTLFSQMFYMPMQFLKIFCLLLEHSFSVPHQIFGFFFFKHKGLKSSIIESKVTTAIFNTGRHQWDSS